MSVAAPHDSDDGDDRLGLVWTADGDLDVGRTIDEFLSREGAAHALQDELAGPFVHDYAGHRLSDRKRERELERRRDRQEPEPEPDKRQLAERFRQFAQQPQPYVEPSRGEALVQKWSKEAIEREQRSILEEQRRRYAEERAEWRRREYETLVRRHVGPLVRLVPPDECADEHPIANEVARKAVELMKDVRRLKPSPAPSDELAKLRRYVWPQWQPFFLRSWVPVERDRKEWGYVLVCFRPLFAHDPNSMIVNARAWLLRGAVLREFR